MLHEQHARHQDTGIANQQTAGLEDQPAIEIARRALDHFGISLRPRRRFVVVAIGNAEAAPEIDVRNRMTVAAQRAHELGEQRESIAERIQVGDLAADMHVDTGDLETRQPGGAGIHFARAADRNAELVFGLAGGDLVMRLGVDIGVHTNGDVRGLSLRRRNLRQQFKFRLGLDIDAENTLVDRERQFARGLAQT